MSTTTYATDLICPLCGNSKTVFINERDIKCIYDDYSEITLNENCEHCHAKISFMPIVKDGKLNKTKIINVSYTKKDIVEEYKKIHRIYEELEQLVTVLEQAPDTKILTQAIYDKLMDDRKIFDNIIYYIIEDELIEYLNVDKLGVIVNIDKEEND